MLRTLLTKFGCAAGHGHVDGHADRGCAFAVPLGKLAAGFVQNPGADAVNQARFLRDRDEAVRRHQRLAGRLPAQQGLAADDLPAGQIHLGLVVKNQFLACYRVAQAVLDAQAFGYPPG